MSNPTTNENGAPPTQGADKSTAQCPQLSFGVQCRHQEGHEGACDFGGEIPHVPGDEQWSNLPAAPQTRWRCTYAQDVPYYADFNVPAESQEEAERIVARLLESGQLAEILDGHAEVCWDNATNERVFASDEAHAEEYEALEELALQARVKLPDKWTVPPPAEPAALALTRNMLKAQLALWDALRAMEKHAELDISSQDATEWAVGYKDAREIDAMPAEKVALIYAAIIHDAKGGSTK